MSSLWTYGLSLSICECVLPAAALGSLLIPAVLARRKLFRGGGGVLFDGLVDVWAHRDTVLYV